MVVLILEKATKSIRGVVSRWMIEPGTGVFVGNLTSTVREQIWDRVTRSRVGAALLIYRAPDAEWGYKIQTHRNMTREINMVDGIPLVRIPPFKAKFDKATKGAIDA